MSAWWLLLIIPAALAAGLGIGYALLAWQFGKGMNW